MKRWRDVPPVSESVAAFVFGGKPSRARAESSVKDAPIKPITNADIVRDMNIDRRHVKWQSMTDSPFAPGS